MSSPSSSSSSSSTSSSPSSSSSSSSSALAPSTTAFDEELEIQQSIERLLKSQLRAIVRQAKRARIGGNVRGRDRDDEADDDEDEDEVSEDGDDLNDDSSADDDVDDADADADGSPASASASTAAYSVPRRGRRRRVKLSNLKSMETYAGITQALAASHTLFVERRTRTKRDFFYGDKSLFRTQTRSDQHIDDAAAALGVTRNRLRIVAANNGLLCGALAYTQHGQRVDCSAPHGVVIPTPLYELSDVVVDRRVRFVLVIEKEATFQNLVQSRFHERASCVLVTGCGYPRVATRELVRSFVVDHRLRAYCLTDADPFGADILACYALGSTSLDYDSENLVVPYMRWLGVHTDDVTRFEIPAHAVQPLSDADRRRGRALLDSARFAAQPVWRAHVERMLAANIKVV